MNDLVQPHCEFGASLVDLSKVIPYLTLPGTTLNPSAYAQMRQQGSANLYKTTGMELGQIRPGMEVPV